MFETRQKFSEKRELEDKELKSELPDVTANEVPQEKKVESLLIQPPETIKILDKTEGTAATNFIKVADVNVVNKGDVEAIEGGMIIDKHLIVEADSVENAGVIIQTTDLAEGSIMDIGKLEKVCNIEEKMGNISSTETTSIEQDLEKQASKKKKRRHKTEEETESSEAAKDKLDESSSAAEGLDAGGNLENSSMVFEEGSQETIESSEKMKYKVEILETFKEESKAELKDIMKGSHNGEQNEDNILKAIDTADSSPCSTDKVDELTEPEAEVSSREPVESMRRKSMDLVQTETLTMECKNEGVMAVTGKDDTIAEDRDQIETPKHEEYLEQGSRQTNEPLLNLSKVDLDDKNGSAEVEIPNKNGNNLCVTHPPVEVTVQVGGENHDEIPISESGDQVREAFEVHKEEEMQINEIYEAGKRPESIILEHTFNVRTSGPFNQKANEATKSGEAVEDNLHEISSTKVVPGAGENLENSSMAFEKGSQQTTESSENKKDVTSKDEIQTKNSESSLVQKVEDICFQKVEILETFKEETETETELKDIIKGSQIGEHNQNEILKTIATADSIQIITCKVDDNSEPIADVLSRDLEESTVRESKDLAQTEALTMESKHEGLTAVADEDDTLAKELDQIERTKHEEHLEQSFMQKTEPTKENSESTLDVASEEIREQIPVGRPEEFLGETRNVETEISDDINKETLEEKNLSILNLDEKNRSAEVEFPSKNENNLYLTHPTPMEKKTQEGGEKHSEASMLESEDQGHEAPKEEEQHFNETYEASKSPESTILEHTSTGVPVDIDDLEKGGELNIEEESRDINTADNIKEEIEQKEKASDEEFRITCDDNEKHTIEEEMPVMNSTPLCTGEEVDHYNQEDKSRPNNSEEATPESNGGDQSHKKSNESLNVKESITEEQVIQEYQNLKTPDKGDGLEKEMKIEENITTEHSLESTRDDTTKCCEENDTKVKCKVEIGKELETISEGEDIGKQVLAEENRVEERSMVSAGELEAESSKEDAAIIKMPKQERHFKQLMKVQMMECKPKRKMVQQRTTLQHVLEKKLKNECSYEEEKEEKEPDTEVLKTNYRAQDTTEHMVKNCVSIQSAESFEDKTIQESSHRKIRSLNANTECIVETFDAAHSAEEREVSCQKSEAERNEGWKDVYITESTGQEITPKESNLDLLENSSAAEISKQEICEEILEKADSKVTVVVDETSLTEANAQTWVRIKAWRSQQQEHAETDEAAKTYTEGKNKASDTLVETEDLSEIAHVETFLDASEQIIESSALSLEEHKVVMVEASEITDEALEKDGGSCGKEHIPSVAEIAKDNILEMEDVTKNPTKMGSTDIEKESANVDAQDEDQEMYTPSKLINEKHMNESDVELLNRVSTGEAGNCSEIAKLDMIEDENPPDIGLQKDKSENETAFNEASKGDEACDRGDDNEKHTIEEEMPVTNSTPLCTGEEMGKELETTNEGEDIEKQVLAEESIVQECSIVFAGELETENSKEDAMIIKMPKQEVIEVLQTADGSTNVEMQTKEEDGTTKDNFAAGAGEETKNECSYEEEKEEKEPDTEVGQMNSKH
ncbi:hypothetical protein Acr_05g0008750 [Actinidia rufa]|uniref:Uncharacterized protein n=1 Tax=Actinidia rufa TaxID=165716 RepID=A0A7J0EM38_9ERIC|nr:hypothetical protein Acr_05g0008750 [Actinidia rufa]